ncbi:MAG: hypothetical protein Q8M22_02950 [Actinomycetota bacterium]|nr:hypothetical protein [Actinomycetota bacterium]
MDGDRLDARSLFRVAPADYVSERTRLVKAAKAEGNKAIAAAYQGLKRPNLPMWAVLAAADDDAVRFLLAATAEVAATQAGGGNSGAITTAMQHRRTAIDALVERAVDALAKWDDGAEARRPEIRSLVDQLSRLDHLADSWLDGTLRDLPDDSLGFASFTEMALPARQASTGGKKSAGGKQPARTAPAPAKVEVDVEAAPEPARETAEERAARAERVARQRQARKDLAATTRELITATRRVETATTALHAAQEALQQAEAERADVIKRRADAEAVLADGAD